MFGKTIERAQFSQGTQFVLCERNTSFEIVQRFEPDIFSFSLDFFSVFLAQSVYDAKSETNRIVVENRAMPIGLLHANRQNFYTVSLRILHNRCRGVKAHRLIVNEACVKFRCAM